MFAMPSATLPAWRERLSRPVMRMAGLLALAVLAGCAVPGNGPGQRVTIAEGSVSGSYLAGRIAGMERDTASAVEYFSRVLAADPDNRRLQRQVFVLMLQDGRTEQAAALARRLLDNNPKDGLANLTLAVEAFRNGRPGAAIAAIDAAPRAGFMSLLGPLIVAWAGMERRDVDAALDALVALDGNQAFEPFRAFHTALIYDFAGRRKDAMKAYETTLQTRAGNVLRVALAHAAFLARGGQRQKALEYFEKFLAENGPNPVIAAAMEQLAQGRMKPFLEKAADGGAEALLGAATVLAQDNARSLALVYGNLALWLSPGHPGVLTMLGEVHERNGNYRAALKAYEGVAADSPYYWNAQSRIAWTLNNLGRRDEAVAKLREILARHPDRELWVALGDMLRGRNDFAAAAAAYGKAIAMLKKEREQDWSLYYARGIAYERAGEWKKAEADFLHALKLRPDQPLVLNYLGYSWVDRGENLARARRMIERAVELRPDDGYIIDSLGWVLYRAGKYDEAVARLEKAIELKPEDPVINDHLGDAYWRVGRIREARFQWRRALSFNPDAELAAAIKRKIRHGLDGGA